MTPAQERHFLKILDELYAHAVGVRAGAEPDKLLVRNFRGGPLPDHLRNLIRKNKGLLLDNLPDADTGWPRWIARELRERPPTPPKPVAEQEWDLLTDGFYPVPKDVGQWQLAPATDKQRSFLRSLGFKAPADATKGEASWVLNRLNPEVPEGLTGLEAKKWRDAAQDAVRREIHEAIACNPAKDPDRGKLFSNVTPAWLGFPGEWSPLLGRPDPLALQPVSAAEQLDGEFGEFASSRGPDRKNSAAAPAREAAGVKAGKLSLPLRYHGGKSRLAKKIVGLMPSHKHYVEPFAGGLAVLLHKNPEGISEVMNDLDGRLTNFWRVLQDPALFERFRRIVQAVPVSEAEWEKAHRHNFGGDPLADAVAFFVNARQSFAGRQQQFTPLTKRRHRYEMNEQASAWLGAVAGLQAVHKRLKRVVVLNKPAVEVIRQEDGPGTLFYCDPPYLNSTRTSPDVYRFEMSEGDHVELLDTLKGCKGKAMLSGYPSELYDTALVGWTRHAIDIANQAAKGAAKRRMCEVVWCNF